MLNSTNSHLPAKIIFTRFIVEWKTGNASVCTSIVIVAIAPGVTIRWRAFRKKKIMFARVRTGNAFLIVTGQERGRFVIVISATAGGKRKWNETHTDAW